MIKNGKHYIKLGLPSGNSFPTVPAPAKGDIFYREDQNTAYVYNGATFEAIGGGGGGVTDVLMVQVFS